MATIAKTTRVVPAKTDNAAPTLEALADGAEEALDALLAEQSASAARYREALDALDVDRALALEARARELPTRILAARVAAMRAQAAVEFAAALALEGEGVPLVAAAVTAEAKWREVVNTPRVTRADVEHARASYVEAAGRARAINEQAKERRRTAKTLERGAVEVLCPAARPTKGAAA